MDRIALISDVHGNIPALEAVLSDIRNRSITRVFCLGDLVGKGPEPAASVDICKDVCEKIALGNWDAMLADEGYPLPSYPPDILQIVNWHRGQIGGDRLRYLMSLPGTIEFIMSGKNIRLFHASQVGIRYRVRYKDPIEKHLAMFDNTEFTGDGATPDVVGYADIHFAFQAHYGDRVLFNVGSVGNPLDRTLACYAIMQGEYAAAKRTPFSVEIIRVPYDIEESIGRAHRFAMPEIKEYEIELRTARYRGLPPSSPAE